MTNEEKLLWALIALIALLIIGFLFVHKNNEGAYTFALPKFKLGFGKNTDTDKDKTQQQ